MNRRIVSVAAAAAVVAGVLTAVVPQHATSVARLAAATVAVVTGGLVLAATAPVVSREPPRTALDHVAATGAPALDPQGLRDARRDLDRPAVAGSLPPSVRDRLRALHVVRGDDRVALPDVIVALPSGVPAAGTRRAPAATAALVHDVLDALDSTARSRSDP